jgi:tetratricopeptide (TPR) repeat protein
MSEAHSQLDTPALKPGDTLSQFQVMQQLGSGGSSVVWQGYDSLLDRYVAIKQLLVSPEREEAFHTRFRQEVAMLKQLGEQEPRLVKLIEAIDDHRGAFIITEYVDGPSLEQLLASSGQPSAIRGAMRILYALSQALMTLHQQGVIHRDLKPTNLLLPRSGGLKICDLGLATLIAEQEALTLGSARYMAPELFRGEQADGRADLYAVGMILYEMLAGRSQFEKTFKTLVRDPRNQAMRWMKWHTNNRLTAPALNSLNPQVPQRLSDLIGRMMEKDPAKRLSSAEELNQVIERHFNKQSAASGAAVTPGASPTDTAEETPIAQHSGDTAPLPKRRAWPWAVGGITAGIVAVAFGAWLAVSASGPDSRAQAIAEARQLIDTAQSAYTDGQFAKAQRQFQQAVDQLPKAHNLRPEAEAGLLSAQVRVHVAADEFDQARDQLSALESRDITSARRLQRLRDELEQAETFTRSMDQIESHLQAGELEQAQRKLQRWTGLNLPEAEQSRFESLRVAVAGRMRQRRVASILEAVNRQVERGDRAAAIERLTEAQDRYESPKLRQRLEQLQTQKAFESLRQRAERARTAGEPAKAIDYLKQALELQEDEAVRRQLRMLQARQAIQRGQRMEQAENLAAARQAFNRALGFAPADTPEKTRAETALNAIERTTERQTLVQLGEQAMREENYDVAIRQFQRAIDLDPGDQDAELRQQLTAAKAGQLVAQGERALHAGDYDKAKSLFEQAKELNTSAAGTEAGLKRVNKHLTYQEHLMAGDKLRDRARYAQAKLEYRKARQALATEQINQRLNDVEYELLLAQAQSYIAAEQWQSAAALLRTAQKRRDSQMVRQLLDKVRQNQGEGGDAS